MAFCIPRFPRWGAGWFWFLFEIFKIILIKERFTHTLKTSSVKGGNQIQREKPQPNFSLDITFILYFLCNLLYSTSANLTLLIIHLLSLNPQQFNLMSNTLWWKVVSYSGLTFFFSLELNFELSVELLIMYIIMHVLEYFDNFYKVCWENVSLLFFWYHLQEST